MESRAGPLGARTTAYVAEHSRPGDLVIDYGAIAGALGARGTASAHGPAIVARNALLKSLQAGKLGVAVVWLISANPEAGSMFPFHRVHVVDPGLDEVEACELDSARLDLARRWDASRSAGAVAGKPSRAWQLAASSSGVPYQR
ncbi:MAG: hypothetical protein WAV54_15535 [Acidimicrobiales bacterium]